MNKQLIMTIIAQDKPGIITTLAEIIKRHHGNWLDSRMSHLAGEFAGIIHVEVPSTQHSNLIAALTKLIAQGITVTVREAGTGITDETLKCHNIDIIGPDRNGIVAETTQLLATHNINILKFDTDVSDAAMTGGVLFSANAIISTPLALDLDDLQDKLRDLANELGLHIEWTSQL